MTLFGVDAQCCFCHSPLEQAALAFLPGAKSGEEVRETVTVLLGLAVVVGCLTAAAAAILPMHFPGLLARDAALWPPMQAILPQVIYLISLLRRCPVGSGMAVCRFLFHACHVRGSARES